MSKPKTSAPRRRGPWPEALSAPREIVLTPADCRRRRERLSLTVYELSRNAGLEEQTVWRFEGGLVRPRQVTVVALHNALGRLETRREQDRVDGPAKAAASSL